MSDPQDGRAIAIFMPSIERGGVERTVLNLTRSLADVGYQIDLLYVQGAEQQFEAILDKRVRLVRLPADLPAIVTRLPLGARTRTAVGSVFGLARYLRRERPKVLLSFQSSAAAVLACKLSGTRTRLIVRESNTPTEALQDMGRARAKLGLWL
ncbi:MAG: glycosyltransferase, partial [Armatimonadetes bacterium]|nr:glycosyltransferase [Armatimonadota bacterium]